MEDGNDFQLSAWASSTTSLLHATMEVGCTSHADAEAQAHLGSVGSTLLAPARNRQASAAASYGPSFVNNKRSRSNVYGEGRVVAARKDATEHMSLRPRACKSTQVRGGGEESRLSYVLAVGAAQQAHVGGGGGRASAEFITKAPVAAFAPTLDQCADIELLNQLVQCTDAGKRRRSVTLDPVTPDPVTPDPDAIERANSLDSLVKSVEAATRSPSALNVARVAYELASARGFQDLTDSFNRRSKLCAYVADNLYSCLLKNSAEFATMFIYETLYDALENPMTVHAWQCDVEHFLVAYDVVLRPATEDVEERKTRFLWICQLVYWVRNTRNMENAAEFWHTHGLLKSMIQAAFASNEHALNDMTLAFMTNFANDLQTYDEVHTILKDHAKTIQESAFKPEATGYYQSHRAFLLRMQHLSAEREKIHLESLARKIDTMDCLMHTPLTMQPDEELMTSLRTCIEEGDLRNSAYIERLKSQSDRTHRTSDSTQEWHKRLVCIHSFIDAQGSSSDHKDLLLNVLKTTLGQSTGDQRTSELRVLDEQIYAWLILLDKHNVNTLSRFNQAFYLHDIQQQIERLAKTERSKSRATNTLFDDGCYENRISPRMHDPLPTESAKNRACAIALELKWSISDRVSMLLQEAVTIKAGKEVATKTLPTGVRLVEFMRNLGYAYDIMKKQFVLSSTMPSLTMKGLVNRALANLEGLPGYAKRFCQKYCAIDMEGVLASDKSIATSCKAHSTPLDYATSPAGQISRASKEHGRVRNRDFTLEKKVRDDYKNRKDRRDGYMNSYEIKEASEATIETMCEPLPHIMRFAYGISIERQVTQSQSSVHTHLSKLESTNLLYVLDQQHVIAYVETMCQDKSGESFATGFKFVELGCTSFLWQYFRILGKLFADGGFKSDQRKKIENLVDLMRKKLSENSTGPQLLLLKQFEEFIKQSSIPDGGGSSGAASSSQLPAVEEEVDGVLISELPGDDKDDGGGGSSGAGSSSQLPGVEEDDDVVSASELFGSDHDEDDEDSDDDEEDEYSHNGF